MKLKNLLLEAETFTATNKASGKTAVFKSKDSRDAAIKAGTHTEKEDDKTTSSKTTSKKVNIFDKPTKSEPTTTQQPKKRPGNPSVNKEAKKKAEQYGITPQKLGNDGYKKTMLKAAVEALTDANFHDEARELVATIEKKPEWAKRVDYPKFEDPKYQEKMADIRKNGVDSSEYWNGDDNAHEYGRKVSQASGWDGVQAADAIAFTLRMNGFHKEADTIQSIFDNKPYMRNEGRISLSKLVNESEAEEIANLTGLRTQAVKKFIDDNNIDDRKLLAYLKIKGPKTLSNRMDISTAIVGKPNNKFAQGIIKAFQK